MSDGGVREYLRLRVAQSDVHYAGLVDGAFLMRLFGDLATYVNP